MYKAAAESERGRCEGLFQQLQVLHFSELNLSQFGLFIYLMWFVAVYWFIYLL